MKTVTVLCLAVSLTLLSACSDPGSPAARSPAPVMTATGPPPASASAGTPSRPAGAAPSASPSTAQPGGRDGATSSSPPVAKVERSGDPARPTTSASPTSIDGTVRYPDGITLEVRSVSFAEEKGRGPGSFPGRAYAVMTLQMSNQSRRPISMATVVVTVLDAERQPVAPVYSDEVEVQDFSGTLGEGEVARARYAFAVPESSRSEVTVVVDFDGGHTSAVFRGKLR